MFSLVPVGQPECRKGKAGRFTYKSAHRSIAPSLHHSITPSLHHSITPSLHHSITPSLRRQTPNAKRQTSNVERRTLKMDGRTFWRLLKSEQSVKSVVSNSEAKSSVISGSKR